MKLSEVAAPLYNMDVQVIYKYQVSCEVFLLIYYEPWEILLGTSDDGIYCWNGDPKTLLSESPGQILRYVPLGLKRGGYLLTIIFLLK